MLLHEAVLIVIELWYCLFQILIMAESRPANLPPNEILYRLHAYLAEAFAERFHKVFPRVNWRHCNNEQCKYEYTVGPGIHTCTTYDRERYEARMNELFENVLDEINFDDAFQLYYQKVIEGGLSLDDIPDFHKYDADWRRREFLFDPRNPLREKVQNILINTFVSHRIAMVSYVYRRS